MRVVCAADYLCVLSENHQDVQYLASLREATFIASRTLQGDAVGITFTVDRGQPTVTPVTLPVQRVRHSRYWLFVDNVTLTANDIGSGRLLEAFEAMDPPATPTEIITLLGFLTSVYGSLPTPPLPTVGSAAWKVEQQQMAAEAQAEEQARVQLEARADLARPGSPG